MAGDDKGKKDFSDILSNINRKFEIIHTKWDTDCKQFEIKLRTQIPRDNEDFNSLCDEWVELFSDVTDTVWAKKISNTGPKIRFRKQYQCWTQGGKTIQKELLFDARRCKATLDMKVLTDNPLSRRKNKHIRLGLNVVVKMNFYHLHQVDTTQPFAFFVHNCEPQAEVPKPVIQSNERLAQLVAAMVQNGPTISQKAAEKAEKCIARLNQEQKVQTQSQPLQQLQSQSLPLHQSEPLSQSQPLLQSVPQSQSQLIVSYADTSQQLLQDTLGVESQTVELVQSMPLQSLESIKLEGHQSEGPSLQSSCTQFVVSTPQFDVSDHFLLCQPLMFDTSQVIPLSNHTLPSHFVHVQSSLSNDNGQFL